MEAQPCLELYQDDARGQVCARRVVGLTDPRDLLPTICVRDI